ncbi:hypothetical protein N7488_008354 [Penicillium malachiteum]|nr:hypothetical protein N7488_008354 [Penicillium malachiteum]
MTSSCRGHQYPGNFLKYGSIRPDVPPFGPAPIIKSNYLTFSPIHQQYYYLVPEIVARKVGYLIKKKTNNNTVRRYLFGFGAVVLGPKHLTTSYPIVRQAIDFEGGFNDDLDLQQPVWTRLNKEVMAPDHTQPTIWLDDKPSLPLRGSKFNCQENE